VNQEGLNLLKKTSNQNRAACIKFAVFFYMIIFLNRKKFALSINYTNTFLLFCCSLGPHVILDLSMTSSKLKTVIC